METSVRVVYVEGLRPPEVQFRRDRRCHIAYAVLILSIVVTRNHFKELARWPYLPRRLFSPDYANLAQKVTVETDYLPQRKIGHLQ